MQKSEELEFNPEGEIDDILDRQRPVYERTDDIEITGSEFIESRHGAMWVFPAQINPESLSHKYIETDICRKPVIRAVIF